MYPATGSPLSLLDSYILKTLKNSSLPKTIWRSYLTRKTVRTVQCLACISRLGCREEPQNVKIMAYMALKLSCLYQGHNVSCFPATNWIGLRKLQEFDVSDNRLVELPTVFLYCFKSLNILNVSRNQLKVFPDPWACPLVS